MDNKKRMDLIVKEKLGISRERAKELIEKGHVSLNGKIYKKSGEKIDINSDILIDKSNMLKYVSRGGLKLEKALKIFNVNIKNKVCFDIGASTGGFTDCMLQNEALKVYAIDVGNNQIDKKLLNDNRVSVFENTNVKSTTYETFGEKGDFASIDVSFISLTKVLDSVISLLKNESEIIALIKPQFEAGRNYIGKNGIIKKVSVHKKVLLDIYKYCENKNLSIINLTYSPIRGGNGNIEFLIHIKKNAVMISEHEFVNLALKTIEEAQKL